MKGKLTAFLLSGTLVVSGISQIVLADDQIKNPVIEKNDEEIFYPGIAGRLARGQRPTSERFL